MSLPDYRATVVIPTLAADATYLECVRALEAQTIRDFEIVIVDNSGRRAVAPEAATRVVYNDHNAGYGAAINLALRESGAPFIATLNDDAVAHAGWLEALLSAMAARYEIGMCASQVRLAGEDLLDSAGMLICGDGSSKQRGHVRKPSAYPRREEVLLPSASAALYRREMLDEVGAFDESFFLYCEDTDLGLRARWAGWECVYVPEAVVEHGYSHSAGRASRLKAYYVERNRLFLAIKNFPLGCLLLLPFFACLRYFWHAVFALSGRGTAARFAQDGNSMWELPLIVLRAHAALLSHLPRLLRERRRIKRRLTARQFRRLLKHYSIGPRQVAEL